jgi:hypothetical protein
MDMKHLWVLRAKYLKDFEYLAYRRRQRRDTIIIIIGFVIMVTVVYLLFRYGFDNIDAAFQ